MMTVLLLLNIFAINCRNILMESATANSDNMTGEQYLQTNL